MVLLSLLIACPTPDDPGHSEAPPDDTGETGFPDLPRDTGLTALAEAERFEGLAEDGLGEVVGFDGELWAAAPQRSGGRGAVCRIEAGELTGTCWLGRHQQAFAGNALEATSAGLALGSFWDDGGAGAVFLVGPEGGPLDDAAVILTGTEGSYAGISLGQGDIDDDGVVELAIGAFAANTSATDAGVVWLVETSSSGSLGSQPGVYSVTDGSWLGIDVELGDVDGDGVEDLLTGAMGEDSGAGAAYLFLGPLEGIVSAEDADARLGGGEAWTQAGKQVALGDLDGDGRQDLAIAAPDGDRVSLIPGPAWTGELAEAEGSVTGAEGSRLGFSLALSDLEGDGRADLLIGASRADDAGAAYVFYGPFSGHLSVEDAAWTLGGEAEGDKAGSWVQAWDGQLYVGAPGALEGAGRVYLP
jgi:hypothetical protein